MADLRDKDGKLVDTVDLPGEPVKAPTMGKLGDPVFAAPLTIKPFLSGKVTKVTKANLGSVTFTVMTPGGLHRVTGVFYGTRMADAIGPDGTKRQQIAWELKFGAIGFDADQMDADDPVAHKAWVNGLITDYRAWRSAKYGPLPIIEAGAAENVFTD